MQPLSYQIGRCTCWGTSIINGIMYLRWKYLCEEDARCGKSRVYTAS